MKHCLFGAAGICAGLCAAVMLVASAGATLREAAQETVLSLSAPETAPQAAETTLCFPILIEGTSLMAESLALYEGDMLEDGSDTHLVDAAALELRNFGDREVEMAEVILQFGETEMVFFGTNIPSGSTVLIIEQHGQPWTEANCTGCMGWAQYADDEQLLNTVLTVTEVDMGTIRITNISETRQENILLYHKNYLSDADLYLGGITYQTYIGSLDPGQSVELSLYPYASGYSRVVKAVTIKEAALQ